MGKNKNPSLKSSRGKKLPNRHPGVTKKVAEWIRFGMDFPFHYEKALQNLFRIAAIVPSLDFGLLPSENLTVSCDGTCVHTHSDPFGHKVCGCVEQGLPACSCPRHSSDLDVSIGWDSDLGTYYFGYTLYMIACHNEEFHIDLPLHFRFLDAKRHDSVGGLVSLAEFRSLNADVCFKNLCHQKIFMQMAFHRTPQDTHFVGTKY